jgi:hypothetical protein
LEIKVKTSVTRLGEFSPIGRLFGQLFENYRREYSGLLITLLKLCIDFDKKELGLCIILAIFSQTHLVTLVKTPVGLYDSSTTLTIKGSKTWSNGRPSIDSGPAILQPG